MKYLAITEEEARRIISGQNLRKGHFLTATEDGYLAVDASTGAVEWAEVPTCRDAVAWLLGEEAEAKA